MPNFTIRVVNSDFSSNGEYEMQDLEAAKKGAVAGALQIGVEQITQGHSFFAAEVSIEEQGDQVARYVVTVGASALI
jgi:hypothetical protein